MTKVSWVFFVKRKGGILEFIHHSMTTRYHPKFYFNLALTCQQNLVYNIETIGRNTIDILKIVSFIMKKDVGIVTCHWKLTV